MTPPFDCIISSGAPTPAAAQRRLQRPEVASSNRTDVGVDDGRAKCARTRRSRAAPRDDSERKTPGRPLARSSRRSAARARRWRRRGRGDGDRLDARLEQRLDDARGLRDVQWLDHLAVDVQPLGDLGAQPARHQRLRLLPGEVVEAADPQPPDLQDVPEPSGGDQAGPRALVLQDGVRRDGGPVDDCDRVGRNEPPAAGGREPSTSAPMTSSGADVTLRVLTRPPSSMTTRSLNVPPMSMPTR